jgi:cold shock protein
MRGTVKWFSKDKHYGFITAEDGKEVFCHQNDLDKSLLNFGLLEGDSVEFKLENSDRGYKATEVTLVEDLKFKTN